MLPIALVLLALGGFLVVPAISLMTTNLHANRQIDRANLELYAADAGIENVLWSIRDNPDVLPAGGSTVPLNLQDQTINGMNSVTTTITDVGNNIYRIDSIATSPDGHNTQVRSYIEPSGNLSLFECALASPGDVWLKSGCTVTGDIYCGGTMTPADFVPEDGEVITEGMEFPTTEENQAFADTYKDEAMQGGTYTGDMTIPIGDGVTVTPLGPKYITGSLFVKKNNIIRLDGTIYVEGSIDVDLEAEFTGTGSIIAVGDIYLSKMSDYGIEGTSIIMSLTGDIIFKKEADVAALIYAPEGMVTFDKDADIYGAVIAGEGIQADKDGTFSLNTIYYDTLELPGYGTGNPITKTYIINPPPD